MKIYHGYDTASLRG